MNTITAIRNRILQLCEERNLTINKLATISAISPSSLKSILYGNSNNPKILTLKMLCENALRWSGYYPCRIFRYPRV